MKIKNANLLVYFWSVIFLLPIAFVQLFHTKMIIRDFNYPAAVVTAIWLIKNWHDVKNNDVSVSSKAICGFFISIFFAFQYSLISKYLAFQLNAYDFGIFQSLMEGMLYNNFGYSSVVGFYHFGTHQNYILCLILPVYAFFHDAAILQITIACVIWGTACTLWLICKQFQLNSFYSFFIVCMFALSPLNGLDTNFMPETFLPLFFALSYLFYLRKNLYLFIIAILLALSVKEDAALYILGFAALVFCRKDYLYAAISGFLALIVFNLNIGLVQPYFVAKSHMLEPTTLDYWSQWGHTKGEIVTNLFIHPWLVIRDLFNLESGIYRLYLPFLFFPLLLPEVLLPSLLVILMAATTNNFTMHGYKNYYGLTLNLIVFIGLIKLFAGVMVNDDFRLLNNDKRKNIFYIILLGTTLLFPLWGTGWQSYWYFNINNQETSYHLKNYLETHYRDKLICPQSNLYPQLLASNLSLGTFDNSGKDFFEQKNCVTILTDIGDPFPFTFEQINQHIAQFKCNKINEYYVCER